MKQRVEDVRNSARTVSLEDLQKQAEQTKTSRRSLAAGLRDGTQGHTRIIAEVKKASPSAGPLSENYQPAAIAAEYERCGAIGISVLTEPRHFLGSIEDLRAVRESVALPILRKDFVCDRYQVYEAAANSADVVLLICAMLSSDQLRELHATAISAGLEAIAEIHSSEELAKALPLENAIIGVNSRNLKTLKTDLAVPKTLAREIPRDRIAIAESGIKSRADIEELQALGYKGFLIGETLMRSKDIAAAFEELTGGLRR